MVDSKNTGVKQNSEYLSKRHVALIAAASSILVAVVSGLVSFFVSTATVDVELRKLESQDTLARAELFQKLVKEVESENGSSYALLALWKIYPKDKKLIVITALQNPSPQKISTLQALGFRKELEDYDDTIKRVMLNSTSKQREHYTKLFLDVSPNSVLETVVEAVIRSRDHRDESNEVLELVRLLDSKRELSDNVVALMTEDKRIKDNVNLRITLSLVLYSIDDNRGIRSLFSDAEANKAVFKNLAKEFGPKDIEALKKVADREILLDGAFKFLRSVSKNEPSVNSFSIGLDLVERLEVDLDLPEKLRKELVMMMTEVFEFHARRKAPPIHVLKRLVRYAPKKATDLYLKVIACSDFRAARNLFYIFDVKDLSIDGWDGDMTYDLAKSEAKTRLLSRNIKCL